MTIQKLLLVTILLSTSVFAADRQLEKSHSELKWSDKEDNCIGKVCVKFNDKTPDMFEKMDKLGQQGLKEPPAFRNSNNDNNNRKSIYFSFGDE